MFPRHANCMCAVRPANVGESQEGQKRTRKEIVQAINDSLRAEIPKKDKKRTLAEQRKLSWWVGAGKPISKQRPQPIVTPTKRRK